MTALKEQHLEAMAAAVDALAERFHSVYAACLPLYLVGCKKLLALVGPTYIESLKCVIEVFTYGQMVEGALERIKVVALGDAVDFTRFVVEEAEGDRAEDRSRLLTAIEAAFGKYSPFEALVRSLLPPAPAHGSLATGRTAGCAFAAANPPSSSRERTSLLLPVKARDRMI